MALEAGNSGIVDIPEEVLRETMNAVVSAIGQSAQLSSACEGLMADVVGAGSFFGPAASMAMQAMAEINADLQKVIQHGTALAEHLGLTADVMQSNEDENLRMLQSVLGNLKG